MKRVSARAIIIEEDYLYAIFRRKIKEGKTKEYYVIPGGGIEENETLEECVKREIHEELNVDIEVLGYLGSEEKETTISHFFLCKIIKGVPHLGGKEKELCSENNFYEIRKININDLEKYDVYAKDLILKAYKNNGGKNE